MMRAALQQEFLGEINGRRGLPAARSCGRLKVCAYAAGNAEVCPGNVWGSVNVDGHGSGFGDKPEQWQGLA